MTESVFQENRCKDTLGNKSNKKTKTGMKDKNITEATCYLLWLSRVIQQPLVSVAKIKAIKFQVFRAGMTGHQANPLPGGTIWALVCVPAASVACGLGQQQRMA